MQRTLWTDEQLVAAIAAGGNDREAALRALYHDEELKRQVIGFVRNHAGQLADGQDVFHEGLIVLDRNVRAGKFRGEAPLKGYLYSICRFLWNNQWRKQRHTVAVPEAPPTEATDAATPEAAYLDDERKTLLGGVLRQLGERCQQILELWKLSFSMEEIAAEVGFSSADMARKAKYRCHLQLLELLRQQPHVAQELGQ
jgi:RNA polymerase sigma factor (sigma-70 family)